MSIDFHLIWHEQCKAAQGIQADHGTEKALGYLIGEKLVNFVKAADEDGDFASELPKLSQLGVSGPPVVRPSWST